MATSNDMSGSGSADPFNANKLVGKIGNSLENSFDGGYSFDDRLAYVPISGTTRSGIDAITTAANDPYSLAGLRSAVSSNTGIINNGGLTPGQRGALDASRAVGSDFGGMADSLAGPSTAEGDFRSIAGSLTGPSAAERGFTTLYNRSGGPSLTENELMDVARGDYLSGSNPYFEDYLSKSLSDIGTETSARYGATGRYGSSVASEGIGNAIADASVGARAAQYDKERAAQVQALGLIEGRRDNTFNQQATALSASDAARLAQLGARSGAITSADAARLAQLGARSTALGNELGANAQVFSGEQAGVGNLMAADNAAGSLYDAMLQPGRDLVSAGNLIDADANAYRAAQMDKFQRKHNGARDFAMSYLEPFLGSGAVTGGEEIPWYQQLLGYGVGLAGNALSGGLLRGAAA